MFNALPFQRGTDPQTVIAAYVESLRGVSLEGIRAGIQKFLRGECEDVSPRYIPTPPELARIVRTSVVQQRVPQERQIPRFQHSDEGERLRMRLKMPMLNYAFDRGLMDNLDKANRAGFGAMVGLAYEWNIPVPAELLAIPEDRAEREWQNANNRADADVERNPPPFMRHHRFSNRHAIDNDVHHHAFERRYRDGQYPAGSTWFRGTVYAPAQQFQHAAE